MKNNLQKPGGEGYKDTTSVRMVRAASKNGSSDSTVVTEFADNSIDAKSKNCEITLIKSKKNPKKNDKLIFSDDGSGMNHNELKYSFKISPAESPRQYNTGDLGKFGMGGTISSFFSYEKKTTVTKTFDKTPIGMEAEISGEENRDYVTHDISADRATKIWEENCIPGASSGTVIVLEENHRETHSEKLKRRIEDRVSLSYSDFISNQSVSFRIRTASPDENLKEVEFETISPGCPAFSDVDGVEEVHKADLKLPGRGKIATVRIFSAENAAKSKAGRSALALRRRSLPGSPSASEAHGFHFSRGGRFIQNHYWPGEERPSNMPKNHASYRWINIVISFNDDADDLFGINNTKNDVKISDDVWEVIYNACKHQISAVKQSLTTYEEANTKRRREKDKTEEYLMNFISNINLGSPKEDKFFNIIKLDKFMRRTDGLYNYNSEEKSLSINAKNSTYEKIEDKEQLVRHLFSAAACARATNYAVGLAAGNEDESILNEYKEEYTHLMNKFYKYR